MQKILIVDDSPTMRHLVQSLLETNGYETAMAENGAKALEQVAQSKPDLIIADVNMPVMNGIDMIRAVRDRHDKSCTPIIALTTETSQTTKDRLREVGASAWVAKPYSDDVLLKMLADFLN